MRSADAENDEVEGCVSDSASVRSETWSLCPVEGGCTGSGDLAGILLGSEGFGGLAWA